MTGDLVAPAAVELTTPIALVAGVGRDTALGLRAMGLTNVGRLVAHLPSRHEREEAEAPIADLKPGQIVSARGEITACRPVGFGRKQRFEAVLCDDSGRLDLVWFNMPYLARKITPGARLRVQGKAQERDHAIQIVNPTWEMLENDEPGARDARLRPVYPATEAVSSRQIERVIGLVLDPALRQIEDHLADAYRRERELPTLAEAYRMLHAPASEAEVEEGRRRLAYDELLLLQLGVALKRQHLRARLEAPALEWSQEIDERIRARLPFAFTPAQEKVVGELARDLSGATPTNRLVQGDVGSGKTAVALYAMLMAVAGGHQAALMAPTELLAEQHFASIEALLAGSQVRLALLTGSMTDADRAGVLARLREGEIDIAVGTHALLTESVEFRDLAVAVIDEQHRFGVEQRAKLRVKGMKAEASSARELARPLTPHVVVMTATPIPRSIGLTLFGDLDLSVIDGMPPGRAIETRLVPPSDRAAVYAEVRADRRGRSGVRGGAGDRHGRDVGRFGAQRPARCRASSSPGRSPGGASRRCTDAWVATPAHVMERSASARSTASSRPP
ncbi:MAG: DEAD/DEAH box helicase [Phycisphaerales bacterium]